MSRLLLLVPLAACALSPAHAQAPRLALDSPGPEAAGHFGREVAGVPDVDGDGRGDFLVGAPYEDGGATDAGRVYVYSGATGALLRTLTSPSPAPNLAFGTAVAGVTDTDGDGRGDLLVGAVGGRRAYLFSGATGLLLHTLAHPNPGQTYSTFGYSVSGVPDADGDGRGDLLVGDSNEGFEEEDYGVGGAYLFSGATGALLHQLRSSIPDYDEAFGHAVAGVPDVTGDGRGDLLIGTSHEYEGGYAFVFDGATGALSYRLRSPTPDYQGGFGVSVAGVPDTDGDGRGDVLVGAYAEWGGGYEYAGRAHLFSGATGTRLRTLVKPNPYYDQFFGNAVSGVPDVDGDGRGDLLIGALYAGADENGRAYLFSGATGTDLQRLTSADPESGGRFGVSVASVPDTDGDGRDDLLVGALETPNGVSDAGRAYLFRGGPEDTPAEPGPVAFGFALTVAPNPARGAATLRLTLDRLQAVAVAVFDALGRRVAVLHDGPLGTGTHALAFDTAMLPAGVYVVRAEGDRATVTRRLIVAR